MTQVKPLSKALNPQLLPGRCSVGCPLFQVCVHLDGLNAENTFHYRVILCITVYETNKADRSLIVFFFYLFFLQNVSTTLTQVFTKSVIYKFNFITIHTLQRAAFGYEKKDSPTSKKKCDIKFTSSPTNGMRGTIWLLLSTKLTLLAKQMFLSYKHETRLIVSRAAALMNREEAWVLSATRWKSCEAQWSKMSL